MTNIWMASSDGNLEAVKGFIESGISVDAQDEFGYSALHAAVSYGHKDLIEYLFQSGASVNLADPEGDTPLFVCELEEIAKLLIEHKADPKHINQDGITAAENAEEEGWTEVAHYLRELTGVPHPNPEMEELEDGMDHLLKSSEDEDDDDEDDNADEDDDEEETIETTEYQDRIRAIMEAATESGQEPDEEALKAVVQEMLTAAGQKGQALGAADLLARK